MATFEQALDKAFEVTWQHSVAVEGARANPDIPDPQVHEAMVLSAEASFIGAVDILGSLLHLSGRLPSFELSTDEGDQWMKDSTQALAQMMEWAHENGRITEAEYAGYRAVYGVSPKKITQ
jgi:hypothetical protein